MKKHTDSIAVLRVEQIKLRLERDKEVERKITYIFSQSVSLVQTIIGILIFLFTIVPNYIANALLPLIVSTDAQITLIRFIIVSFFLLYALPIISGTVTVRLLHKIDSKIVEKYDKAIAEIDQEITKLEKQF